MYSIGDNHSYLHFNCEPIDQMINHLERYFSPDRVEEGFDLAIEVFLFPLFFTHRIFYQIVFTFRGEKKELD